MVEACRKHDHRDHAEHAQRGADERGPDRNRRLALLGPQCETEHVGHRRLQAALRDALDDRGFARATRRCRAGVGGAYGAHCKEDPEKGNHSGNRAESEDEDEPNARSAQSVRARSHVRSAKDREHSPRSSIRGHPAGERVQRGGSCTCPRRSSALPSKPAAHKYRSAPRPGRAPRLTVQPMTTRSTDATHAPSPIAG